MRNTSNRYRGFCGSAIINWEGKEMNPSKFLSVNELDVIKSCITATIGIALATGGKTLLVILDSGSLPALSDLKVAAVVGLTAGLSSILRRFFSGKK